jgi:hypothetical protein
MNSQLYPISQNVDLDGSYIRMNAGLSGPEGQFYDPIGQHDD